MSNMFKMGVAWASRLGLLVLVAVMAIAAQATAAKAQGTDTDTRRPAAIQSGTCDSPGDVVFELNSLVVLQPQSGDADDDDTGDDDADDDDAGDDDNGQTPQGQTSLGQFVGPESASVVERSDDTEIRTSLDDLVGSPHVVTIFESEGSETIIACGEIGGFVFSDDDDDDEDLVIGLREQGDSGFAGVAAFDDEDDDSELDVDLYLARDVTGAATTGLNADLTT
jgi:hypothetical protein